MSADAEIPPSAAYRVSLPEFEGPLDLLLHLCKTHEIDIVSLPVAFITEKYLEYLEMMQSMSVEVAAEYLVMAATLAYLKSRELVPTPEPLETVTEEGEEALDPREELIRRLLEYQKYKDAAEKLAGRPIEGRNVFGRGMPMDGGEEAGLAEHSVWKLIEAWSKVLDKAPAHKKTHDVLVDRMSISDRINQLVDKLEAGGGTFRFENILDTSLPEPELRHQVVVTLLAVLELARLRVIRVLQDGQSGEFFITQREGAVLENARKIKATSDNTGEAAEEEPAAAEPAAAVAVESAAEEPVAVESAAEEPAAVEAVAETMTIEAAVEETVTIEAAVEETVTIEAVAEETVTIEAVAEETVTIEAASEEPAAVEAAGEVGAEPVAEEPPVEEAAAETADVRPPEEPDGTT